MYSPSSSVTTRNDLHLLTTNPIYNFILGDSTLLRSYSFTKPNSVADAALSGFSVAGGDENLEDFINITMSGKT